MILLAVPSHILLTDLQSHVVQAKNWLQGMCQVKLDFKVDCKSSWASFPLSVTEEDCLKVSLRLIF